MKFVPLPEQELYSILQYWLQIREAWSPVSKYREFAVYSMNKTRGKCLLTRASVAR